MTEASEKVHEYRQQNPNATQQDLIKKVIDWEWFIQIVSVGVCSEILVNSLKEYPFPSPLSISPLSCILEQEWQR